MKSTHQAPLSFYISICEAVNIDTQKVYPGDFDALEAINDYEMYGINPNNNQKKEIKTLLLRALK